MKKNMRKILDKINNKEKKRQEDAKRHFVPVSKHSVIDLLSKSHQELYIKVCMAIRKNLPESWDRDKLFKEINNIFGQKDNVKWEAK